MRKLYILTILLFILPILGCATSGNYDAMLKNWHGKSIDDFLLQNGEPRKKFANKNGNTVHFYLRRNPELALLTCKTWIESDTQGIIVETRWAGGNCAAYKYN